MTEEDIFIKAVKQIGLSASITITAYTDGHVSDIDVRMKASESMPIERFDGIGETGSGHVLRRLFEERPAALFFGYTHRWHSLRDFLYGSENERSIFEWVSAGGKNINDTAVSPFVRQAFAEIAAMKLKTAEELEFYLDLYFGENEKKAA